MEWGERPPRARSRKIRHSVTNEIFLRNSQIHPSHDPSRDGWKRHKVLLSPTNVVRGAIQFEIFRNLRFERSDSFVIADCRIEAADGIEEWSTL